MKKKVLTTLGRIELPKVHLLCPLKSKFNITVRLQEQMCWLGQVCVYREAEESFKKLCGLEISDQQIKRVCTYYGEVLDEVIQANIEPMIPKLEETTSEDPTYVMMDGAMLFTRPKEWKELKLARIFMGSKVIDIQKSRSEITDTVYCSHLGGVNKFFPKLERHLQGYRNLVVVGDGAKWIWNWCEDNYPGCVEILDFYHAKEKLVILGNLYFKDKQKKDEWLNQQLSLLRNNEVYQVILNVKKLSCRTEKSKEAKAKLVKYYTEHEDRMKYKTYREAGLLIGSGPIEAAHRSVIQQRMKLSGQKWSIRGANAVANLRCFSKSNAWDKINEIIKAAA